MCSRDTRLNYRPPFIKMIDYNFFLEKFLKLFYTI